MNPKLIRKKNEEFINSIQKYVTSKESVIKKCAEVFNNNSVEELKIEELREYSQNLCENLGEYNVYISNYNNDYSLYNQKFLNEHLSIANNLEIYCKNRMVSADINMFINKSNELIKKCFQKLKSDEQILAFQELFVTVEFNSDIAKKFVYLRQVQFYIQEILRLNDNMKTQIKLLEYLNCELESESME